MSRLNFSYENVLPFISETEIDQYVPLVADLHRSLQQGTGAGSEYLGWLDMAFDAEEVAKMKHAAEKIKRTSDVLLVIGVGGSYLGAHAALEMLGNQFQYLKNDTTAEPKVIFVGHHLSASYTAELLDAIQDKSVSVNVISKSGTTMEPAIAFRIFRQFMEEKYGRAEAAERIYVTTDAESGALKTLASEQGYETFVIPDNVGGRYSVLTPVGLLPMAASGIDIEAVIQGAKDGIADFADPDLKQNTAYQYAVIRNILYKKKYRTEILANYNPKLRYFSEWWVQLFGESEGKDGKGIFPSIANFPTDLHSLGQYIQDGPRNLFETVLRAEEDGPEVTVGSDEANLDELNYLAGKSLQEINRTASDAALKAHVEGGVPNMIIDIPRLDAYTFGYLVYFFEKACAMSGYILQVNPFDQPGVESYKKYMFSMLGKPGYNPIRK